MRLNGVNHSRSEASPAKNMKQLFKKFIQCAFPCVHWFLLKIKGGLKIATVRVDKFIERISENQPAYPASTVFPQKHEKRRFLIASHNSYINKCTTFGDTAAMTVVIQWMEELGVDFDVACLPEYGIDGLNLAHLNPMNYHTVIFVCGPWSHHTKCTRFRKFEDARFIGIDLSVQSGSSHELDLLIPRDYKGEQNPDLAFISKTEAKPLIGVALVHSQGEYGDRQRHDHVHNEIYAYLKSERIAWITLDTLWHENKSGIPDIAAFENLISRLDAIITTRMHGLVFSLKNGIPALAIDPIFGGAKVSAQASALEWPLLLKSDDVSCRSIEESIERCLSGEMTDQVLKSQEQASQRIRDIESRFKEAIQTTILSI